MKKVVKMKPKVNKMWNRIQTIPKHHPKNSAEKTHTDTITLNKIIENINDGVFEYPEEYQRGFVTSWGAFGQSFVTTAFAGSFRHFDKLHFRYENGKIQIVEGQQRLRSIQSFFEPDSNLKLGECIVTHKGVTMNLEGLTWSDIEKIMDDDCEELAPFQSYIREVLSRVFDISVYENYKTPSIADIFQKINNKVPLNDQEFRNSFGGEACIAIRKTARHNAERDDNYKLHPIFEQVKSRNSMKGKWMKINPARYEYEKLLAEFCLFESRYDESNNFVINKESIDKMYRRYTDNGEEKFDLVLKPTLKRLSVIHNMVKSNHESGNSGVILTKGDLFALYGLLYHSEKHYFKNYTVDFHPRKFLLWFLKTHIRMSKAHDNGKEIESDYGLKCRKAARIKKEIITIFNYWHNELRHVIQNGKLSDTGITLKDGTRVINDSEAREVWVKQDCCDSVTGEYAPLASLDKGHIVPYSLGGETSVENTVMINEYDNKKMGATVFNVPLK